MKIVLLHYAAPPIVGGVEMVMGQHARLMTAAGHRVRIIAGRGGQLDRRIPFIRLALADSRHSEILTVKSGLDAGTVPAKFEVLASRLEARLRTLISGADWLIAHNVGSLNKNLPLTAAIRRIAGDSAGPRVILWHHDLAWTTPRYLPELHEGYPWDLLCTDWPQVIQVTVSNSRRDELADLLEVPAERIHVVPNGLAPMQFLGMRKQTQALVERLHLMDAAPLILLPVRITPRKNIELALSVLKVLQLKFPHAQLLVTGPLGAHNAANSQYFSRLIAQRRELGLEQGAHFLAESNRKPLPDAVVADLYRLADLLLLPSTEEGFGIPVLEAGLAGIPVFCTEIRPLQELGGAAATYFPVGALPHEVAAKISDFLDSSAQYALRKRVLRDYRWEKIYSAHIAPLLESGPG